MTPIKSALSIRETACVPEMRTIIKIARRYDFPIVLVLSIAIALFFVMQLPGAGNGGLAASVEKSLRH